MKTIKQTADHLGVHKDKIKYLLKKIPGEFTGKKDNITYITDDGIAILKGLLSGKKENHNRVKTGEFPDNLPGDKEAFYQNQITAMQKTIEIQAQNITELTAALENTTESLKAAQALHAGTMQKQLTEPEENKGFFSLFRKRP